MEKYKKKNKTELLNDYENARMRNDYFEMAVISSMLAKRTAEQASLYGQYLMALGKLDEAKIVFDSIDKNENNYFKLSGLFQIAFEKQNFVLASNHFYTFEAEASSIKNYLTAYKLYISKILQRDFPAIVIPPLNSESEEYLNRQIDTFKLENTLDYMESKIAMYPQLFDFGGADIEGLLEDASSSLIGIEDRGNQVNSFSEPPMFFDKYYLTNGDMEIEVATLPFTKDIYAIKPMTKGIPKSMVHPLTSHKD